MTFVLSNRGEGDEQNMQHTWR